MAQHVNPVLFHTNYFSAWKQNWWAKHDGKLTIESQYINKLIRWALRSRNIHCAKPVIWRKSGQLRISLLIFKPFIRWIPKLGQKNRTIRRAWSYHLFYLLNHLQTLIQKHSTLPTRFDIRIVHHLHLASAFSASQLSQQLAKPKVNVKRAVQFTIRKFIKSKALLRRRKLKFQPAHSKDESFYFLALLWQQLAILRLLRLLRFRLLTHHNPYAALNYTHQMSAHTILTLHQLKHRHEPLVKPKKRARHRKKLKKRKPNPYMKRRLSWWTNRLKFRWKYLWKIRPKLRSQLSRWISRKLRYRLRRAGYKLKRKPLARLNPFHLIPQLSTHKIVNTTHKSFRKATASGLFKILLQLVKFGRPRFLKQTRWTSLGKKQSRKVILTQNPLSKLLIALTALLDYRILLLLYRNSLYRRAILPILTSLSPSPGTHFYRILDLLNGPNQPINRSISVKVQGRFGRRSKAQKLREIRGSLPATTFLHRFDVTHIPVKTRVGLLGLTLTIA